MLLQFFQASKLCSVCLHRQLRPFGLRSSTFAIDIKDADEFIPLYVVEISQQTSGRA